MKRERIERGRERVKGERIEREREEERKRGNGNGRKETEEKRGNERMTEGEGE